MTDVKFSGPTIITWAQTTLEAKLRTVLDALETAHGITLTSPTRYRRSPLVDFSRVPVEVIFSLAGRRRLVDGDAMGEARYVTDLEVTTAILYQDTSADNFEDLLDIYGWAVAYTLEAYVDDETTGQASADAVAAGVMDAKAVSFEWSSPMAVEAPGGNVWIQAVIAKVAVTQRMRTRWL